MSKPNPKNFKPFIDPDGGEWIEITGASKYKGVIWRPFNIEFASDNPDGSGNLQYEMEQLTTEGQELVIEEDAFQKLASDVIVDIIRSSIKV